MPLPPDQPALAQIQDAERLLSQFEQAWRGNTPPAIENLLRAAGPAASPQERRYLLEESIKIDLYYRWCSVPRTAAVPPGSHGGPSAGPRLPAPCLEDYVQRFPEIGGVERLSLGLVGEEYRVRRSCGDRPDQAEYLARFRQHAGSLPKLLAEIDAELAAEFAEGQVGAAAVGAPDGKPAADQPIASVAALMQALRQYQVLPVDRLNEVQLMERRGEFAEPRAAARELLQRGWLTSYQANLLLQGRAHQLVLGPYLVLERLGEGGAGQVYKVRHRLLGRTLALKLIRPELANDADIIQRFYREIQVVSRLAHPHIVQALDAGLIGGVHVLGMEHVEGIDLARLVKQQGPLPAAQAADYVRQAALGLHHIHEQGLVHRDIKPSNLIVAGAPGTGSPALPGSPSGPWGLLKILDLGLARLQPSGPGSAAGGATAAGTVLMGTVDYMAPEQALDFRRVDARADLYSLGCTFYFLLTGGPPFPEGMVAQKLLLHQLKEPVPVEQSRPDLPAGLPALLRRMTAKRPEDRFQTAAEVARALDGDLSRPSAALRQRRWLLTGALVLGAVGGAELCRRVLWPAPVYLADLPVPQVVCVPMNRAVPGSFEKGSVKVNGTIRERGFKVRPPDRGYTAVTYPLGKRFQTFEAAVALMDGEPLRGPSWAVFSLRADGKTAPIWESDRFRETGVIRHLKVSVAGANTLELRVYCESACGNARACWLEPRLSE